jgi:hypothetical protein
MYDIQHCFVCRPSDFIVSEDAGIEPRAVATAAMTVRRSHHSARSHLIVKSYLLKMSMDLPSPLINVYKRYNSTTCGGGGDAGVLEIST